MKFSIKSLAAVFASALLILTSCGQQQSTSLPRGKASQEFQTAFDSYIEAVNATLDDQNPSNRMEMHSIMVVKNGKVIAEKWMNGASADSAHILNSVSKTFTSTAVGLAISDGLMTLEDKLIDYFPEDLPEVVSDNLAAITVKDLLTMNCGHDTDPTGSIRKNPELTWAQAFLAYPVEHTPGTYYCYNSLGTYMLSAIVTKVTGQKVVDYLTPRIFEPLGIDKPTWQESPQGINCGGWGLYLKTEDLAKIGQLILNGGKWNGKQLIPSEWFAEASKAQVPSAPAGVHPEDLERLGYSKETSDWVQGYGYQMWRCRHNAFRADGAQGQYIIVIPDKNTVIATTANIGNMQGEINYIWDYLLPVL